MLFEQGQECPACGGISAGEEDPPKTGIQLAEVCWEDWEDWGAEEQKNAVARSKWPPAAGGRSGVTSPRALLTASSS